MLESSFNSVDEAARLGYSLAAFTDWTLAKVIETIAGAAYKSVELCLDHPELDADKLTDDHIDKIKNLLKKHDLHVSAVSCYSNQEDMRLIFENRLRGIDVAVKLGCRILVLGCASEGSDPGGENTRKYLAKLLQKADTEGVTIAIDPEPGTVIHGYYEFSMLARQHSGMPLGLNLNLTHATLTEKDVFAVIEEWAPFIVYTHISDCANNEHTHLLPGDGKLDLQAIMASLRKNHYRGDFVLHITDNSEPPDELARIAMDRCQKLMV
jgi:sugar phosphate isomerase/epimerase